MRHQTHANRVHFGTSIFVTFSPSERDNTLMMKLTRARKCDPALTHDDTRNWQGRDQPKLDEEFFTLDADAIIDHRLP
eukprot:1018051-Amphidinium_carterae.1